MPSTLMRLHQALGWAACTCGHDMAGLGSPLKLLAEQQQRSCILLRRHWTSNWQSGRCSPPCWLITKTRLPLVRYAMLASHTRASAAHWRAAEPAASPECAVHTSAPPAAPGSRNLSSASHAAFSSFSWPPMMVLRKHIATSNAMMAAQTASALKAGKVGFDRSPWTCPSYGAPNACLIWWHHNQARTTSAG